MTLAAINWAAVGALGSALSALVAVAAFFGLRAKSRASSDDALNRIPGTGPARRRSALLTAITPGVARWGEAVMLYGRNLGVRNADTSASPTVHVAGRAAELVEFRQGTAPGVDELILRVPPTVPLGVAQVTVIRADGVQAWSEDGSSGLPLEVVPDGAQGDWYD